MKLKIMGMLGVFLAFSALVFAETIEFVTYYPSPTSQQSAHISGLAVGNGYQAVTPTDGELIVFDRTGIGPGFDVAAPVARLQVVSTNVGAGDGIDITGTTPRLLMRDSANNTTGGFGLARVADNYGAGTAAGDASLFSQGGNLRFGTGAVGANPTVRMSILNNGNVGIGTAAPVYKLEVRQANNDYGIVTSDGTVVNTMGIDAAPNGFVGTRSNHSMRLVANNGTGEIRLTPAGNVGINNANPQVFLDVAQNNAIRVGNAYLSSGGAQWAHFASNAWFNGGANWTIPAPARASGLLQFSDSNIAFFQRVAGAGVNAWTARMTITPNGNVGIRTGAPRHPLEVVGAGTLTTFGWNQGILLDAGTALSWDRGAQANSFFMAHPSGGPPGDFWAGFSPALNGTTAPTYVYRIIIGSGQAAPGTVQFFNPIIAAGATFPSDERLKTRVLPLTDVLGRICGMQAVSFEWNELYETLGYHRRQGERTIGLMAQQVERVFPELVSTWGEHGYKGVDYSRLTTVLVEAVKEQQGQIRTLQSQNDALKKRVEKLEK